VERYYRTWRSERVIRVFVEVTGVAAPLRVKVRAESIGQAVATIEELHPDSAVQVVFPIDPEEFFVEDSQGAKVSHSRSGALV
jgi:D-alanyl-D-alanine dipeptidase